MKRLILITYLFFISVSLFSQSANKQTQSFTIQGKIKETKIVALDDLKKLKSNAIGDISITNHKGDAKGVAKGLVGVLLKDILETVVLDSESPKQLSEYYFTCIASDGYKVVFSWNEIFNTATGNSVYIITEKDNTSISTSDESILMISTLDFKTGRRFVKNLESITVNRVH